MFFHSGESVWRGLDNLCFFLFWIEKSAPIGVTVHTLHNFPIRFLGAVNDETKQVWWLHLIANWICKAYLALITVNRFPVEICTYWHIDLLTHQFSVDKVAIILFQKVCILISLKSLYSDLLAQKPLELVAVFGRFCR